MPAKKMDGNSLDVRQHLLEILQKETPQVFTEGKIDPAKLAATLGQDVSGDKERYGLNWAGKSDCFRHIQEPTTATLKPIRKESTDFDTTENIFIEGDNLQVLKVLQKSYYGKVKMIYIDPPYNTGSDSFIYPDRFQETQDEYLKRIGDKDAEGNLIRDGFWRKNNKDAGHFHSNWLSMMYPRLFLARNLLRQDGVIFISINDNEVHNLRMIMDEIYGEDNFVGQVTWKARVKPVNIGDAKYRPQKEVEYVLVYQKNCCEGIFQPLISGGLRTYPHEMSGRKYRIATILKSNRGVNYRSTMSFELEGYTPPNGQRWQAGEDEIKQLYSNGYIEFRDGTPFRRYFEDEEGAEHDPFYCFMEVEWSSTSETGKHQLNDLLGDRHGFDTVKPTRLIYTLVQSCVESNNIVLDFFAGTCTTADAVMQLNAEDGRNRKYICVQLPEPCEADSEAAKAGFKTIADIGKERIRRATKKIKEENKGKLDFDGGKLDLGFKVFKLDESNFKEWRTANKTAAELEKQLTLFVNNVKDGTNQEDILYELILKAGQDLNVSVEEKKAHSKTYYKLDGGKLIVCLEEKITQGLVDKILAEKCEKFICLDRAFAGNDQLKTNTALQMEAEKVEFKVI